MVITTNQNMVNMASTAATCSSDSEVDCKENKRNQLLKLVELKHQLAICSPKVNSKIWSQLSLGGQLAKREEKKNYNEQTNRS